MRMYIIGKQEWNEFEARSVRRGNIQQIAQSIPKYLLSITAIPSISQGNSNLFCNIQKSNLIWCNSYLATKERSQPCCLRLAPFHQIPRQDSQVLSFLSLLFLTFCYSRSTKSRERGRGQQRGFRNLYQPIPNAFNCCLNNA